MTDASAQTASKKFNWIIQQNEAGSLMTLDVPFKRNKSKAYLTIIISKRKGEARPDVISVMVPEPLTKSDGLYLMFARAEKRNGKTLIIRDTNMTANASFSNCNSEFCTVQINNGYLSGRSKQKAYDVLDNLMKFDEATFLYFDKAGHETISVPLESFKKQYKELP
jgi:hypothetical protein